MFEKLLSLVPYNPGIIHQLSFYSHRMREEASIRRAGMVFIVLAFLVQSIAVINPPVSASKCRDNSMLECGITSIRGTENTSAKQSCRHNRQGFMQFLHYYGISCSAFNTAEDKVIHTDGQNYLSSGRDLSPVRDHPVDIPDNGTVFWRDLSVWGGHACNDGSGRNDCWQTISVKDQDDKTFYIIYDCGNLVSVGLPPHNQLRVPTSEDVITIIGNPTTETDSGPAQGNPGTQNPSNDTPIIPGPDVNTTPVQEGGTPQQVYPCKFNPQLSASDLNCPDECPTNPAIPATSEQCFYPCPYNGSISDTDKACKPCDKSTNIDDAVACISVRKTAANITQGIADANNTTAKSGDVITYTLYAENTGKETVYDFTFQENINDVLDYANVVDAHGGTLASDGIIAWSQRDLDPGETSSVQVTVKVKDPIPQTPATINNPGHFDMIMTNVYGNPVNIKLPVPPAKSVELAATKLPNTGPGTTLFIASTVVILAGYFYSRASLLARESDIAIKEQGQV